jgi:hypothetical protein
MFTFDVSRVLYSTLQMTDFYRGMEFNFWNKEIELLRFWINRLPNKVFD